MIFNNHKYTFQLCGYIKKIYETTGTLQVLYFSERYRERDSRGILENNIYLTLSVIIQLHRFKNHNYLLYLYNNML